MADRQSAGDRDAEAEGVCANGAFLEFDQAGKAFDGLTVFQGLTLRLRRARAYGLVGPNACGKTTLLHSAMGLCRLTRGSVRYGGHDVTRLKPHAIARLGLGIVLQNIGVFHRISVLENVLTGAAASNRWRKAAGTAQGDGASVSSIDRANQALADVGLADEGSRLAGSLVPGDQKKVAVARALFSARDFLLDEPVAGVGSETRDVFRKLVRKLVGEGRSILIVEHDIDFVLDVCDEIMLLKDGAIACQGSPGEIMLAGEFREFHDSLKIEE